VNVPQASPKRVQQFAAQLHRRIHGCGVCDVGIALSCARTHRATLVMVVTIIVDHASGPGVPAVGETASNEVCLNPKTSKVALPKGHQFTL